MFINNNKIYQPKKGHLLNG